MTSYNSIAKLLQTKMTIFSNEDLAIIWQITNRDYLKSKIYRLVKSGQLLRLRSGIFALDKNYDRFELANKLVVPSYIGFETILATEGVIFQYDSKIYSASRQNREIQIDDQQYLYRKIKDSVLLNKIGIKCDGIVCKAGKERALVDILYLQPTFYFDNLNNIDWDLCFDIAQIFQNKSLTRRLNKLKEVYA